MRTQGGVGKHTPFDDSHLRHLRGKLAKAGRCLAVQAKEGFSGGLEVVVNKIPSYCDTNTLQTLAPLAGSSMLTRQHRELRVRGSVYNKYKLHND